tara:strand:+ start:53 stop:352 length:300 start_codon:yes stop_codon:yes gene_type:complete
MQFVEVGDIRYPRVVIEWRDIVGDPVVVTAQDSTELTCPLLVTEGYLFDVFEEDGTRYIRTFATYEIGDGFGDRNCFPLSVLTADSKRDVELAIMFMSS